MRIPFLSAVTVLAVGIAVLALPSAGASAPSQPAPHPPPPGAVAALANIATPASTQDSYVKIAPCRVVDTRSTNPPKLAGLRTFTIAGKCGIPAAATSVATNATLINPSGNGFLRAWAAGQPESNTIINFTKGQSINSAPILPLGSGGAIAVRIYNATADFAVDVAGYYIPPLTGTFSSAGPLVGGSGRLTFYSHNTTGYYTLKADRDLTGCVPVASAYYYAYNVSGYVGGTYIYVQMVNSSDGVLSDYYFNVVVNC